MEVITDTEEYTKINEEWVRACQQDEHAECWLCAKDEKQCLQKLLSMCD